jgi:flagellar biosynthetic protein FliR
VSGLAAAAVFAGVADAFAAPLALVEPFVFGAGLVFLRVTGVLVGLPILGNPAIPGAFRTLLLFWLAILVYVASGAPPVPLTVEPLVLLPLALGELLVGAAMGFTARLVLAVAESAGALMGLGAGLGLATAMDPVTGQSGNTIGSVLLMLALVLFVTVGGHVAVVGAILDSYTRFPLGDPEALPGLLTNVVAAGTDLFELSVRLSAPLLVVSLVLNVAMGLLVRVAPQLNLFAVGFLVVITASLLLLWYEVPAIAVELRGAMADLRETLVTGRFAGAEGP